MAIQNLGAKSSGDDEEDTKQHMIFYIMMTSKNGIKARLSTTVKRNNNIKLKQKEKKTTKKDDEKDFTGNFVVRLQEREILRSKSPMRVMDDKFSIKGGENLSAAGLQKKIKNDIKQVINDQSMSWNVIREIEDLKRKKKNFDGTIDNSDVFIEKNKKTLGSLNQKEFLQNEIKKYAQKNLAIKRVVNQSTKNEMEQRNKRAKFQNRWDDFRQRKEDLIDKYIYYRKR